LHLVLGQNLFLWFQHCHFWINWYNNVNKCIDINVINIQY
jgi:hypothetical protein